MSNQEQTTTTRIVYDDSVSRGFLFAAVIWGFIGMCIGLLIALQLSFWQLNFEKPWLTFSRIRPVHTHAMVFALVGNMMFAGIYYSTQRLLKTRMASDLLSRVHLWGWQLIILGAAVTLPLGITQSRPFAEPEWFLDIAFLVVWVAFAVNFFRTLANRNEKRLYISLWFYIATIVTIPILFIVNNLALPISGTKSYSVAAGAQDALTQCWSSHNTLAFFLTVPIVGILYYFLPKAANRPVYSYRLAVFHFWALIFLYIWTGPTQLLYTAQPDWVQSLGMVFGVMLLAPCLAGVFNGLLTLRGAWRLVREEPAIRFFVAALIFYGLSALEGFLLSIKSVSAVGQYTDWTIGHAHSGALGWNGFMAAGVFYWMVPRLFGTKLQSRTLAVTHFWIAVFGVLLYVNAMWASGIINGVMSRGETSEGAVQYPYWAELVQAVVPMYVARGFGGALFLLGWILMIYNLVRTARNGKAVNGEVSVAREPQPATLEPVPTTASLVLGKPFVLTALGLSICGLLAVTDPGLALVAVVLLTGLVVAVAFHLHWASQNRYRWHRLIEGRPLAFTILVGLAILVGGVVELAPGIVSRQKAPMAAAGELAVAPYTPLELEGRDIYVREGCHVCHSQMIRPFAAEKLRYGDPSRIEESMWDRPALWGSKRTGPDLARVGGKYQDIWHYQHMLNPRGLSEGSNMPPYPWLAKNKLVPKRVVAKIKAMKALGVPYSKADIQFAPQVLSGQAASIAARLEKDGQITVDPHTEIVALIAYLQRLGKNKRPAMVSKAK